MSSTLPVRHMQAAFFTSQRLAKRAFAKASSVHVPGLKTRLNLVVASGSKPSIEQEELLDGCVHQATK